MNQTKSYPAILELVPALKKKTETEFAGPCPWCGGDDRFVVWPHQDSGGRFMCRRCQKTGDAIDLLRDQGFSFHAAKNWTHRQAVVQEPLPAKDKYKSQSWTRAAGDFVQRGIQTRPKIWKNLLMERHINIETALKSGIGWNATDCYFPSENWGLDPGKKIRIPAGLVIPTRNDGEVAGIMIRCMDREKNPKYWQVRGSSRDALIIGETGLPVVIVESHLDAYLVWQDSGDVVSVISIGGTTGKIDTRTNGHISQASKVFISTDFDIPKNDKTGAGQSAYLRLIRQFPEALYLPTPIGKDPCEMVSSGIPIRDWLSVALDLPEAFRLPPDYPGTRESLIDSLRKHPGLIPCPKTAKPWYWVYRKQCSSCSGHIHCMKQYA